MPKSRINGVRLYWELTGDRGPTLVLVHGSWGDHRNWDAVVSGLAASFHVLTYDRRGHGQSERLNEQGSIEQDADDLAGILRESGLGPAHVVGSSFGASVVLRAALRHRDVFSSLAVHEPPLHRLLPPGDPGAAAIQERIAAVVATLERGDSVGGARQFVETVAFGPGMWERLPARMRETFVFNATTFLDEVKEPAAFTIPLPQLAAFDRPALLTQGSESPPFFGQVLDLIAGAMAGVQRYTFDHAGHAPHVTNPGEYVPVIAEFAQRSAVAG